MNSRPKLRELDEANNGSDEDLLPPVCVKPASPWPKPQTAHKTPVNQRRKYKSIVGTNKKEIPDRPANQAKLQTQIQEAIKDTLTL